MKLGEGGERMAWGPLGVQVCVTALPTSCGSAVQLEREPTTGKEGK